MTRLPFDSDYYAETEQLAEQAREAGFADIGDLLIAAVDEGFTSTEILMGIRSVLVAALPRLASAPGVRAQAESLVEGINEALGG